MYKRQGGYSCAAGWTGSYCVTVYVGGLHFLGPIHVGVLVEVRALVIRTGRTSLDIAVDVYAGDPKSTEQRRTGYCVIVFVALDADGRPCRRGVHWTSSTARSNATRAGSATCASRWTTKWSAAWAIDEYQLTTRNQQLSTANQLRVASCKF